jgi:hypothetical protein
MLLVSAWFCVGFLTSRAEDAGVRQGATEQFPTLPPKAGWPVFETIEELEASPWHTYLTLVYGELPPYYFPYSPVDLWYLYDDIVSLAGIEVDVDVPAKVGNCPTDAKDYQVYTTNNAYSPGGVSWVWHPYPYFGFPHSWVEVIHERDPFGDESEGAWFLYAPGSAIYFNTGVTLGFPTHEEAYTRFGAVGPQWNDDLCQKASQQGYDSLQFTAHVDHVNYPCDTYHTGVPNLDYMNLEIVGVGLQGTYSCTSSTGAPSSVRAGWDARSACTCDNSQSYFNCKEVPSTHTLTRANSTHEAGRPLHAV